MADGVLPISPKSPNQYIWMILPSYTLSMQFSYRQEQSKSKEEMSGAHCTYCCSAVGAMTATAAGDDNDGDVPVGRTEGRTDGRTVCFIVFVHKRRESEGANGHCPSARPPYCRLQDQREDLSGAMPVARSLARSVHSSYRKYNSVSACPRAGSAYFDGQHSSSMRRRRRRRGL